MRIMLVEDDKDLRETLSMTLTRRGHEIVEACDGMEAWELFRHGVFDVVISDWTMPQMNGIDLCQTLRGLARDSYTYIIMLTAESGAEKMVEALDAGADDFVTKPFELNVLGARLRVAERILRLHAHVNRLEGLLSICSYCKNIRSDDGTWLQIERYIQNHSDLKLSHGICPTCLTEHYPSFPQADLLG